MSLIVRQNHFDAHPSALQASSGDSEYESGEIIEEVEVKEDGRNTTTLTFDFKGKCIMEPTTGIPYPAFINKMEFIGCGVRTKYVFVHAYAVGLYFDVSDNNLQNVKTDKDIECLLMDPRYPRLFRVVMNRVVSSKLYVGATMEVLTPLMRGKDLDKLEHLKAQDMPNSLPNRSEVFIAVHGDILTLQQGRQRAGRIQSEVLTRAICENYLGPKPVSPTLKEAVWKQMRIKVANVK